MSAAIPSSVQTRYKHDISPVDLVRLQQLAPIALTSTHPYTLIYESVSANAHETVVMSSLVPGLSLKNYINNILSQQRRNLTKTEVECIFEQMLLGVQSLHHQNVSHTKLNSENVFVSDTIVLGQREIQVTLGDYLITDPNPSVQQSNANLYIAPECWIHPRRYELVYEKIDIQS